MLRADIDTSPQSVDAVRVFVDLFEVTENESICCVVAADGNYALVPWDNDNQTSHLEDITIEPVYATHHFYANDPDSMRRYKIHNDAETVLSAVWAFAEWLRQQIKYENKQYYHVREALYSAFESRGVSWEE